MIRMTPQEKRGQEKSGAYPKRPEAVTLRDGTMVTVRPIRPDDAPRLQALFARLSPRSIFLRFLGHRKELPWELAERLANVDYQTRMALVATREQYGEDDIVADARYEGNLPGEPGLAEFAIVVEDQYQGRGLGTLLLERLVAYAQTHGIRAFWATVYHDNAPIKRIIQRSGLPIERSVEAGVWEIRMKLDRTSDHSR
jgi:RimJ/RimL family protein N-acetyltransferase